MGKARGRGGCDNDSLDVTKVCGGITCCIVVILASFLIGFSFLKLEPNEVGLDYSMNTETVDGTNLYANGVYFLGVGHKFIKYPRTILELDMQSDPIYARTADGLVVEMKTKLLYRLAEDITSLHNLYLMFGPGKGYEAAYRRASRSVIRDVAGNFTAFQFWSERETISFSMLTELEPVLKDIYAVVDTFTLTNFELPSLFAEALVETDVKREELEAIEFQLVSANITAQTNLLRAEQEVLTIGNIANSTGEAILLDIDARLFTLNYTVEAELNGYKQVQNALNMTQEQLVQFVWLDTVSFWAKDVKKQYQISTPAYLTV